LVAIAVAVMIGLGIWQLQRKAEKEALLTRYEAARDLPPIAWPGAPSAEQASLFRRSSIDCPRVSGGRVEAGRNAQGETGWLQVVRCSNGAIVATGWSPRPERAALSGGRFAGVIGRDRDGIRLVATDPPPGLQPARPPSPEDVPNNHLFYALQWFFFAGAAAVIYVLALRRRSR
jgi:surfeit locus 1 family protein